MSLDSTNVKLLVGVLHLLDSQHLFEAGVSLNTAACGFLVKPPLDGRQGVALLLKALGALTFSLQLSVRGQKHWQVQTVL